MCEFNILCEINRCRMAVLKLHNYSVYCFIILLNCNSCLFIFICCTFSWNPITIHSTPVTVCFSLSLFSFDQLNTDSFNVLCTNVQSKMVNELKLAAVETGWLLKFNFRFDCLVFVSKTNVCQINYEKTVVLYRIVHWGNI